MSDSGNAEVLIEAKMSREPGAMVVKFNQERQ